MKDQNFEGPAYYEAESIGFAEGFCSVSEDEEGIEVSCFAYDQPDAPVSVSITLSVDQARAYALAVLAACDGYLPS